MPVRPAVMAPLLLALTSSAPAAEPPARQQDPWFDRDWERQAEQVSEGELRFLAPGQNPQQHRIENLITLDKKSPDNGWITITQCHYQLDPVPLTEIVYRYPRMGPIEVLSSRHIGNISTERHSVTLSEVRRDASLCLRYKVRHLQQLASGWQLKLGPYYRGFLDGYYPMYVSVTISYPTGMFGRARVWPDSELGMRIQHSDGRLFIGAWFEGRLTLQVLFPKPTALEAQPR